MADPTNADIQKAFSLIAGPLAVVDDNVALIAGSQAQATRARGQMFIITQSVTQGAVVLPALNTNEAPPIMAVINESVNTIRVGCGNATDTMNGAATTATFSAGFLNITTKSTGIFIASQSPFAAGGGPTASPNNWHGAQFT